MSFADQLAEATRIGTNQARSDASNLLIELPGMLDPAKSLSDWLPPHCIAPLSGEWADQWTPQRLGQTIGVTDPDDIDCLADAFETAYAATILDRLAIRILAALELSPLAHTKRNPDLSPSDIFGRLLDVLANLNK